MVSNLWDILYLEFVDATIDYLKTLRLAEWVFDFVLPSIAIGLFIALGWLSPCSTSQMTAIITNALTVAAILVGFTITCLTILVASDSGSMNRLRSIRSRRRLNGHMVNLHKLLVITFSHALLAGVLVLIVSGVLMVASDSLCRDWRTAMLAISLWLEAHVIMLTIRNVTNFYYSFSSEAMPPSPPDPGDASS
jgi:hypothetical protein